MDKTQIPETPPPPAPKPPPPPINSTPTGLNVQRKTSGVNKDIPVAFYFEVEITGAGKIPFKEISGLTSEMELETVREGGNNDFEYKLPKQVKHGNLVMKGALNIVNANFVTWISNTFYNNLSKPVNMRDITISLLNKEGEPMYTWVCTKAYPVKWEAETLDAEKNSVLIESVEFAYKILKRL